MGKPLKNPPVYFTVAQARFNVLLKLADYLPSVQESLRKVGYPAFTHHSATALQINLQDGQPVPQTVPYEQYLFANAAQTHCFVLSPDALTFQSTDYGTFESFSEGFLKGLSLVHETVTLAFTERVGLRYLDHILPKEGEALELYLAPQVQGMGARLGGQPLHSYSETLCAFGHLQLRSRVLIQDGGLLFPPDLLPQGMAVQPKFLETQGRHAVLDTDGYVQGRRLFELDGVERQLSDIHKVIFAAFVATVTDHARNVWDE